jgi:hypothetical protein
MLGRVLGFHPDPDSLFDFADTLVSVKDDLSDTVSVQHKPDFGMHLYVFFGKEPIALLCNCSKYSSRYHLGEIFLDRRHKPGLN